MPDYPTASQRTTPLRLVIHGAAGRMGARLVALAREQPDVSIVSAVDAPQSPHLGRDAGDMAGIGAIGVVLSDKCDAEFDVLIDFSSPVGTLRAMEFCRAAGRPIVIGTTGHAQADSRAIDAAATTIPVLRAANMSLGVNVLLRLARELAAALGDDYDIEIVEAHHRFKADAPSGTALALLEAVKSGRAASAEVRVVHGRHGATGRRPSGEIGVHALRLGDTIGEHAVHFGALGETVTIAHSAHTRDTFAAGALRAARWIADRAPGMYTMQDVLIG